MNNRIFGNVEYKNAEIIFRGTNNIFVCRNKLLLENCKIRFTGSNSLIFIDENAYPMSLNMHVGNNSGYILVKIIISTEQVIYMR